MHKLEQKQSTRTLEERTADVMEALSSLDWMPKYPPEMKHITLISRCIATFCQTVEVNHTHPEYPDDPEWLGWVNPLTWLVDQIASTHYSFPPPIIWRKAYERKFISLDGRTAEELIAAAEIQ
jgi:hypothetical protein